MKAFVAGATGLTGRFVVETLRRRGLGVVAHVRADSARLGEWTTRYEAMGVTVVASAWEKASIAAVLAEHRPHVVFGLLGTTRARASRVARAGGDASGESYDAVDVALTEMLILGSAAFEP